MGSVPRTPEMGVYAITHPPTGCRYIGASSDIYKRFLDHKGRLERGDHPNRALQQAWSSTPPAEWTWTTLEVVCDRAQLAGCELRWIEQLRPSCGARIRRPWRDLAYHFDAERFWARVRKTEACWEWTGCLGSVGYGKVSYHGRSEYAHRVAWIVANGPIAPELCILHRCDNRRCCRPDHLFLGTKTDNAADRQRKGRHRSRAGRGEESGRAKLNATQVRAIRTRYAAGETMRALAAAYGVSPSNIAAIAHGLSWRHIL